MDWFAAHGFDTWTMDCEGYGRSTKTRPINSDVANGADGTVSIIEPTDVITATGNGALAVDSVAVSASDRVLLLNGAAAADNGIYSVTPEFPKGIYQSRNSCI